MSELDLIEWIRQETRSQMSDAIAVGPGDDCAIIKLGNDQGIAFAEYAMRNAEEEITRIDKEIQLGIQAADKKHLFVAIDALLNHPDLQSLRSRHDEFQRLRAILDSTPAHSLDGTLQEYSNNFNSIRKPVRDQQ